MISWSEVEANPALALDYANQQAGILNAQGGTGGTAGNPTLTMGQQYLANNPDVFEDATARAQAEGIAPGQAFQNRVDQIAREHFDLYGMNEGRSGFGYTFPSAGTFAPSVHDGAPAALPPGSGSVPGQGPTMPTAFGPSQDAYSSFLGDKGGLLTGFGDLFTGLLQTPAVTQPTTNNQAGFYAPGQMPGYFGFNAGQNFSGMGGGFSAGAPWGRGPSGTANTGHRQLWTV